MEIEGHKSLTATINLVVNLTVKVIDQAGITEEVREKLVHGLIEGVREKLTTILILNDQNLYQREGENLKEKHLGGIPRDHETATAEIDLSPVIHSTEKSQVRKANKNISH